MTATIFNQEYMPDAATYWAPGTRDGYGGYASFPTPVSINCRWEDEEELFVDAQGREKRSVAVVYPDQVVINGGWLYLGTSVVADPRNIEGALEIKKVRQIKDIGGQFVEVKAWL